MCSIVIFTFCPISHWGRSAIAFGIVIAMLVWLLLVMFAVNWVFIFVSLSCI